MKRADIPTRTTVAYKQRKYSQIEPAYVLDTERLWTYSRPYGSDVRKWSTSTETKFRAASDNYSSRYGDHGFLTIVVHAGQYAPSVRDEAMSEIESIIAALPSLLLANDVRTLDANLPSGAWLGVVNNVRLVGEWLPALEQQTAERKAEDEKRAANRAKHAAFRDLRAQIEEAAEERGFDTWRIRTEGDERLSVPASMLAKLLDVEVPEA